MAEFVGKLAKMKPADYASNVRSAVANRLLADKTIEDVCSRFWPEIDHRQYAFERPETEAAAMRTVPQAEFVEWAEELLLSEATLNRMYILRKVLAPLNPVDSMEFLLEKIKATETNDEFLASMNS